MQYLYLFHSLEQNPTSCQDGIHQKLNITLRLRDTGRMDMRRCTHNRLIMYCNLWWRTALRYIIFLIRFRSSQARFHSNLDNKVIFITFLRDWRRVSWFWQQKFHEFGCMTLGWTISCQNHHHIHQKCRISAQNVTYILEPERNTSPPLGSSLKKSSPVSL